VNKRKILESARKLAQKGSKEKALAEYQKLLKLDPKDAKLRLEIGDAHRRWGQVDQAVETYTRVAEQYMGEGFDARAVAVFKQILNLDPDRFDAYAPLAELYERMGLTAEAINALQTAADGFHRQGRKDEALGLLRKMANVDPSNTTSRIKVADLLRQQDKTGDAIAEYRLAAEELERQGDEETLGTVYRRILEADQTNVHALHKLARNLASRGKVSEAVPLAERAVQLDDANPEHYELLADLFARTDRTAERDRTIRGLAEVYRQRGDEDRARDLLQRNVSVGDLRAADSGVADLDGGDALFGDRFPDADGAPELSVDFGNDAGIDPGSSASGLSMGPVWSDAPKEDEPEELLLEDVAEPAAAPPAAPAPTPVLADDLDVDQLVAEATVYLRYGKRDKAIAHLEQVIRIEPDHRGGLEKLGEAFAENGEHARAVELWLRAARGAQAEGDDEGLRVLRGRIAVLDEAAAASLEPAAPPAAPPLDELDFDAAGADDDLLLDDDELLDDDVLGDSMGTPSVELQDAADVSAPELSIDLPEGDPSEEIEIDVDAGLEDAAPEPAVSASSSQGLSASAKQQVLDDLEEADFYMQQGLHDEAEGIYRRILSVAAGHPRALLRLGEIAAARGESPAVEPELDGDATPVPDLDLDEEDSLSIASDGAPGLAPELAAPAPEAPAEDVAALDLVLEDETEEGEPQEGDTAPDGSDTQELRPNPQGPTASDPSPGHEIHPAIEGAEGDFDLAAALADAFDDDPATGAPLGSSPAGDGFEAVFSAFKKGVSETLGEGDHQAHYDLAIAYKEMGLLDDAINELRTAMADPGRTAECLHLIGLCAIDADQAPLAIEHLEQLLEMSGLDVGAVIAARFDLGRALEAVGDVEGARREWQRVAADAPDFQNVTRRLAGLGEAKPEAEELADEGGLESFDDVMEGLADEAEEPAPEAPGGESFADLVAELGDELGAAEDAAEAMLEAEPLEAPDAETDAPEASAPAAATPRPKPAARRTRKKISFL